jgi:hypothetical protein
VHLDSNGSQLNTDELIPWGEDATITLVFFEEGKYGLQASNGKYLSNSGALKDNPDADTRFIIEFFSSQIAFKGNNAGLSFGGLLLLLLFLLFFLTLTLQSQTKCMGLFSPFFLFCFY